MILGKFLPILNSCSKVPLPFHTQKQYECSSLSTSLLVFALFHLTFTDIEVLSPKEICTFCWGKFLTIVLNVCLFMAIYLKKKNHCKWESSPGFCAFSTGPWKFGRPVVLSMAFTPSSKQGSTTSLCFSRSSAPSP